MKHEYDNWFWGWNGWQIMKWVTGVVVLAGCIWLIWCFYTNERIVTNKHVEKIINKIDQIDRR